MRIRVFISSVQKELLDERMALQILLSTDRAEIGRASCRERV